MSRKCQKEIFLNEEGDKWFERNLENTEAGLKERILHDEVISSFNRLNIIPRNVLEVGCCDGWRLEALRKKYECKCSGVDPSSKAINNGKSAYPNIELNISTADALPYQDNLFDSVIIGFCLYLCDRDKLFKIAYEVDRVLRNNGNLFILDFDPNFAYKNEYCHREGIFSYKMKYVNMFRWNPAYTQIYHESFSSGGRGILDNDPDERISVDVLRKNIDYAYTFSPYRR
jgi:ubiquinone/menaquinone biosynthesis C-methylase UbiE